MQVAKSINEESSMNAKTNETNRALFEMESARQRWQLGGDPDGITKQIADLAKAIQEPSTDPDKSNSIDVGPQPTPSQKTVGDQPLRGGPARTELATRFEASASLHLSRIPTALVHVFDEEQFPLVTFKLSNNSDRVIRLGVQSQVEGYSARAVTTVDILPGNEPKTVSQLPTFFPSALDSVHDATRATLHVEVHELDTSESAAKLVNRESFRIWLLPRTTAILSQTDPVTGDKNQMHKYLASWVTPNDPSIMELLRKCLEGTGLGSIVGYTRETNNAIDVAEVEKQVRAMFETVKAAGIKYVNSTTAAGLKDTFVQRIRLPAESLETRSANCIDYTVLYASLMEAASLNPGIVVIPGHAFVGWQSDPDKNKWDYLETTMTAQHNFDAARKSANDLRTQYPEPDRLLNLSQLRADGILPIA